MATAAPHVKLLRQLASAKDDYLSGAFDISWDGAKATLYLVFGRPSHAVFDTDQAQIEGEAAIDALLAELPRTFVVSDWRRAMSPQETLSISIDELAGPFVRLAGSYADDPVSDENPEWWSSDDSSPDLAFGLADFPLLPGGRPLWAETSPENVNLAERLAELPPSILILTGAKLRAAAVVSGGDIIDAVWIDDEDQARGEAAGMAILGANKGSLAGYAFDDPRVAEALTMLWRLPLAVNGIEMAWLDPASMLAAFRADGLDRVLVIDAPVRGIALFSRGGLVAVYSETQRSAVASPERLRSLLSQARGRLTVMERKPRPVAAGAPRTIPSAVDFFAVVAPEPEAEADGTAQPAEAAEPDRGAVAGDATESEPTAEPVAQTATGADAPAETTAETTDMPPEAAPTEPSGDESDPAADHAAGMAASPVSDTDAPPPPPPGDAGVGSVEHAPPPPAPEAAAEPKRKAKRPWWAFGTRRKSSRQAPTEADRAAAEAAAAQEAAEAASTAGWGIRQPDASAPPSWSHPRDYSLAAADDPGAGTEPPPPAPDAAEGETPALESTPTWSVIEPGAARAQWPAPATVGTDPDTHETGLGATSAVDEVEDAGTEELASATAPAWSAREVIADSVSWYRHSQDPDAASDASADAAQDTSPDDETGAAAETDHEAPAAHEDWQEPRAAAEHEPVSEADHDASMEAEHDAAAESEDQPAAEAEHDITAENGDRPHAHTEHDVAAGTEDDVAAEHGATTGEELDHGAAEGDLDLHDTAHQEADPARDFWAEFATPDHDASAEAQKQEPEPLTASDAAESQSEEESGPAPDPASEPEHEPVAAEDAEPLKRKSSERTFAPWSWPLAEAEPPVAPATVGQHASIVDAAPEHGSAEGATQSAMPDADSGAEQGFFQRDEPIGSQFVDFDDVRKELVQIGIVWLGERNAVPVTALLTKTRSTIDDFVATIDTIRGLHVEGQDPASIQAMAREMHQQAAERLCGA